MSRTSDPQHYPISGCRTGEHTGRASVLDGQVRLGKYITTQEDEAPSLLVEGVVGPLLAQRQNIQRQKSRVLCLYHIGLKYAFAEVKVNADNNLFDKILWDNALLRIRSTHPAVAIPSPCSSHTLRDCLLLRSFSLECSGPPSCSRLSVWPSVVDHGR